MTKGSCRRRGWRRGWSVRWLSWRGRLVCCGWSDDRGGRLRRLLRLLVALVMVRGECTRRRSCAQRVACDDRDGASDAAQGRRHRGCSRASVGEHSPRARSGKVCRASGWPAANTTSDTVRMSLRPSALPGGPPPLLLLQSAQNGPQAGRSQPAGRERDSRRPSPPRRYRHRGDPLTHQATLPRPRLSSGLGNSPTNRPASGATHREQDDRGRRGEAVQPIGLKSSSRCARVRV